MDMIGWLVAFVILIGIEAATMALTTIWFAGGALAAFVLAMLDVPPVIQWAVFCVVSLVLLFGTRPWALRFFNSQKQEKTNVDSLIGKTAVVTAEIHNLEGRGEVLVNGLTWTARAENDSEVISGDVPVEIIAVEGVKLIVRKKKEG